MPSRGVKGINDISEIRRKKLSAVKKKKKKKKKPVKRSY